MSKAQEAREAREAQEARKAREVIGIRGDGVRGRARLWQTVLGLGLCAAAAAGCTATAAGPQDRPERAGEPTEREEDLLSHAEALLTGACMREKGFRYVVMPPHTYPDSIRQFPYGIDDVDWAQRHGFGSRLQRKVQRQADADPNPEYLKSLSKKRGAAYMDALADKQAARVSVSLPGGYRVTGSTKGCAPEAQRALYGDFEGWFRSSKVVDSLPAEYQAEVVGHRDYRTAMKRWAACMDDRGYPVEDPGELRAAEAAEAEGEPSDEQFARERDAATAEARCVRSTGLATTADRLEQRYRAEVRSARKKQIRTRNTLATEALPRAREVIERAG